MPPKQGTKGLFPSLALLLPVLLLSFVLLLCGPAGAANKTDTQKKQLRDLQKKIADQEKKLKGSAQKEYSVLGEIEGLGRRLLDINTDLKAQRKKIRSMRKKANQVRTDMAEAEASLATRRDFMARRLRAVYKYGNFGNFLILTSSLSDMSQLIRRLEYLQRLTRYERNFVDNYKADLADLEHRKMAFEKLLTRLKQREKGIKTTERKLNSEKKLKQGFLTAVRSEQASYEKMLSEMRNSSRKLMDIIKKSEEAGKLSGKKFRTLKGKLPWPVSGTVAIPYGKQKDPRFNTTVFRNGIYLKTAKGTKAKAVHTGKIVYAQWFKGYGQLVIVNHGNGYHSLYADLSEIFLKVGDIIKRGAPVGRVGQSNLLDNPSLYFEIRYKGKPLDPSRWLKRR